MLSKICKVYFLLVCVAASLQLRDPDDHKKAASHSRNKKYRNGVHGSHTRHKKAAKTDAKARRRKMQTTMSMMLMNFFRRFFMNVGRSFQAKFTLGGRKPQQRIRDDDNPYLQLEEEHKQLPEVPAEPIWRDLDPQDEDDSEDDIPSVGHGHKKSQPSWSDPATVLAPPEPVKKDEQQDAHAAPPLPQRSAALNDAAITPFHQSDYLQLMAEKREQKKKETVTSSS